MTLMNVQYKSTRLFSILMLKCKKNSRKSLCTNRIVMLKDVLAYILVPRINWYEVKLWIARATFCHDGLNCYHKPW